MGKATHLRFVSFVVEFRVFKATVKNIYLTRRYPTPVSTPFLQGFYRQKNPATVCCGFLTLCAKIVDENHEIGDFESGSSKWRADRRGQNKHEIRVFAPSLQASYRG